MLPNPKCRCDLLPGAVDNSLYTLYTGMHYAFTLILILKQEIIMEMNEIGFSQWNNKKKKFA